MCVVTYSVRQECQDRFLLVERRTKSGCEKRSPCAHIGLTKWRQDLDQEVPESNFEKPERANLKYPPYLYVYIQVALADPGGPGGPGPPAPKIFFKIMQFSGNFEQILGSPWGQNSTGPVPDQNPGSVPGRGSRLIQMWTTRILSKII